ncbi:MAG: hypothetical protein ACREBW_00005, partial [Candidatus Micrarchaeaceae archaeon]
MITLNSLADHEPDEDPLAVLPCKHVFAVSTLDGNVRMQQVYQEEKKGNAVWTDFAEFPQEVPKIPQCPNCRLVLQFEPEEITLADESIDMQPIRNVRRYGRLLNFILMQHSAMKLRAKIRE